FHGQDRGPSLHIPRGWDHRGFSRELHRLQGICHQPVGREEGTKGQCAGKDRKVQGKGTGKVRWPFLYGTKGIQTTGKGHSGSGGKEVGTAEHLCGSRPQGG